MRVDIVYVVHDHTGNAAGLGVPQTIGDIATQCGEFDAQNVFREPNVHVGDGLEYIWLDTA
jgi:hypothetical protein